MEVKSCSKNLFKNKSTLQLCGAFHKMSGFAKRFHLSCLILGSIFCHSNTWHVQMPSNIKGLKGSCLVIPCSYDYYQYPPTNPYRVVWYQYVDRGYPLVYDNWYPNEVIERFKGKTRRIMSSSKSCTLEISPLDWSHHRQRLYPWVDPENVGRRTYRFFDTTVMIQVLDRADLPEILFFGNPKVGQEVTVQCVVYHTCPSYPPILTLNIPLQRHKVTQSLLPDGTSKTVLTTTLYIKEDHQTVKCSVRHTGGLSATASKTLNAECSFQPLTIYSQAEEFLEGHSRKVTCSAVYTCSKHIPTLTWNYNSMPVTTGHSKMEDGQWKSVSTLTFTASAKDHGKSLTCYAHFTRGGTQEKSITLQVKRSMMSRDWSFTTPGSITGMKGSCVIIPCRFTYSISQPPNLQMKWYWYQSHGYPAVFDIDKFRGRVTLTGSVNERNCSLKIERLEMMDNQNRLYPWVDKNPVTSYHMLDKTFYDKTTELIVSEHAQQPQLTVTGIPRVGEESSVSCSVHHTCISAPPTLTLNGIPGKDSIKDTNVSDATWQRTVERTWNVTEEDQSVKCTVIYPAGQKATTELQLNVECPYEEIRMDEAPGELMEGVAKNIICSVSYKCKKNSPAITWNYEDMQSSFHTKKVSMDTYRAVSNLTFIGSLGDDGKSLICTAQFINGQTSASAALHVKKYEKPTKEIHPHESDTFHVLAADVPFRFSALTRSCVVIPCSFQMDYEAITNLRGIWSKKNGGIVYHNGQSRVLDHFKGRTKILGDIEQQNCSLEIDDIKPFDNGPFCFHAEKGNNKYRFNNSCVFIVMRASPEKPMISPIPTVVDAGSTVNVTCSVTHTCPSHPPTFSWSVQTLTSEDRHALTAQGTWETSSIVTFMAAGGDGIQNLTCTAHFWRGKKQINTVSFTVKGSLKFLMRNSLPAVIPAGLSLLIIILAAVFGVVTCRKSRRHNDISAQPPPRPVKRRSLWERLSRRYPEDRQRSPRPEKRRSIWSRSSSEAEKGHARWQNERKPRNNTKPAKCDTQISKQRFPSPKNNQRAPPPPLPLDSTEDYNIYINF
ncbi:hypothetical protein LDENG_00160090 [Lucifuga dentata]|nr:hypothetical protein LDENG_00160090 [Lucifuga dentata]